MKRLLAIAGADATERTRRFAFLLTVAVTLYVGYLYFPDMHAGYATIVIGTYRGVYDSAYLGSAIAVLTVLFTSLFGFFLIRGSVGRDAELAVGDIVAASPVRRLTFLFGKFASNLAVLLAVAGISAIAAMIMQQIRAEDRHLDLLNYLVPFAVITLPAMAIVAASGVVLDVVKPLRGIFGSIVFVAAIWSPLMVLPVTNIERATSMAPYDGLGSTAVVIAMRDAARAQYPHAKIETVIIGGGVVRHQGLGTYRFPGMHWSVDLLEQRLIWLLIALALVAGISPFFDRFQRESGRARAPRIALDIGRAIPALPGLRIFRAEFALLVNGANVWWMLGAAGIAVACGLAQLATVTAYLLPIAFIWPLDRISSLGSRERRSGVDDIFLTTRRYVQRTQFVQIAAATLLGALVCSGYLVRVIASGHPAAAIATVLVVAATAAAALALGALSSSPRPFQALYLLVWYVGPINREAFLNFSSATLTAPLALAGIAAAVVLAATLAATAGRLAARSR